jgi:PAS domain S-box-containing protein
MDELDGEAKKELHQIFRKDAPFDEKAREALALCSQYLDIQQGLLIRIDQETDHWQAEIVTDGADEDSSPPIERNLQETYCRRTIEDEDPHALHDAPNQGWADDPAFETGNHHTYLGVPLILEEGPYGTVCFVAEEARSEPFSDAETWFVEHLTRLLERELEREYVEAELTSQTNLAAVLNRVLRHNIRNDISVVRGHFELIAEELPDEAAIDTVFDNIDSLIDLTERARELEQVVASDVKRQPTAVGSLVEDVAETVADEQPHATLAVEYGENISAALRPDFERAIRELLENAIEYSGDTPTVSVSIDTVPNAVEIQITDDGPGLPVMEAEVLSTGEETPLSHGRGLGLWLVHWIVTSHEGSIDTTVTEDGTTIRLSIPRIPGVSPDRQLPDAKRGLDRFQAAFEEANDAILILNDDAQIVNSNTAAETLFGLEWEELLGRALAVFTPDAFDFDAEWRDLQQKGTIRGTVIINGADGEQRTVEYSGEADIVPGEHVIVGRDVTERKERERRLNAIFDQTHQFNGLLEPDGTVIEANETALNFAGVDRKDVVGKPFWETDWWQIDEATQQELQEAIDRAATGEFVRYEVEVQGKEGTALIDFSIRPITDDQGTVTELIPEGRDITEVKERERRIDALFNQTYQYMGLLDPDGTVIEANEPALEFGDLDREDVVGKPFWETDWWEGADTTREELRNMTDRAALGEFVRDEVEMSKEEDTAVIDFSIRPATDDQDNVSLLIAEGRDITERKRVDQVIRDANQALVRAETSDELEQRVCDIITDADPYCFAWIGEVDPDAQTVEPRTTAGEGDDYLNTIEVTTDDRPTGQGPTGRAVRNRELVTVQNIPENAEYEPWREDALEHGYRSSAAIPLVQDDTFYGVLNVYAAHIDAFDEEERELLTELADDIAHARDRLETRARQERLEHIVDSLPVGVYRGTPEPDGEVVYANQALADMFDAESVDTLVGRQISEYYQDPVTREPVSDQLLQWGLIQEKELQLETLEGDDIWIELTAIRTEEGDEVQFGGIIEDITERKKYEQEMPLFRSAVESAGHSIYFTDVDGTIEYVNPAFEEITGYSANEAIGRTPRILKSGEHDPEFYEELWDTILAGDLWREELVNRTRSGDRYVIDQTIAPVEGDSGEIEHFVAVNVDITERKEYEQELQQENERLDEFAGVISHDLRNPLSVAQSRLTLLEEEFESEHLNPIHTALERMEEIIDDTLTLAYKGQRVGEIKPVNISDAIGKCWETVASSADALEVEDDFTVLADPDRIRHICENLLRNAIEHGTDEVTVRIGRVNENTIYIEDDGPGIPEDERDTVFDPGYSTNRDGTGLGLAIVKGLAEAHGWDITLTESESGGARFEFSGVEIK